MNVDIHAHYIPESCFDFANTDRSKFTIAVTDPTGKLLLSRTEAASAFAEGVLQIYDIDRRIREMKEQQIDVQVLSVTSACYFYGEPADTAVKLCRHFNDAFADTIGRHPGSFVALANLPMQSPPDAALELERTVRELDFRGAVLGTTINDVALDDKSMAPFYAKAQELDVPLFIHPGYIPSLTRFFRYNLANLLGFPSETAFAAASLIFGGVLKEFPRLKVCLAHGGGCCSALHGRWQHGWQELKTASINISESPAHYLELLYYDSLVFDIPLLEFLVQQAGPAHVLLGTDYPTHMGNTHSVEDVDSLESIGETAKSLIRGGNAAELFKIG